MTLSEYMEMYDLTDQVMADRLGRERSVVTRYRLGQVMPSPRVIAKVEVVTGWKVRFRDWIKEVS